MLKAEAIDLDYFPLYIDFNETKKINKIYSTIRKREAFQILEEIQTDEHKQIDEIVNSNLSFDENDSKLIRKLLKQMVNNRANKSKT